MNSSDKHVKVAEQAVRATEAWLPMYTAPKDGRLVRLLVEFEDHATEDGEGPHPTIGSNTADNTSEDIGWQFAGWCWTRDRYTQGEGKPLGWLPMLSTGPAHRPFISHTEAAGPLNFGIALDAIKSGCCIARDGWNGKGMFVYLVPPASYPAQTGAAKEFFGDGATVPYNAYMAIKNVDGTVSTWVPSVNDCLADDWIVLQNAAQ